MARAAQALTGESSELLLKAALLDGDVALQNWQAWHARVAFDDIDFESQQLLPLLLDNLQRLGVEHADFARYRGVARHIWVDNQLRQRQAAEILALFAAAGISAIPLKGAALASLLEGGARLRAIGEIDILVPAQNIVAAAALLRAQGWQSKSAERLAAPAFLATRHTMPFAKPGGFGIDLFWQLCPEHCRTDTGARIRRDLQPVTIGGFVTRTLSDTALLFHACIEVGAPGRAASVMRIADCARIIGRGAVDWNNLLEDAREAGLVLRLRRALFYLKNTMAQPIAHDVMTALAAMTPGRSEALEEGIGNSRAHALVKSAVRRYAHYRRARVEDREGFLSYLEAALGARSVGGILGHVARRARRGES